MDTGELLVVVGQGGATAKVVPVTSLSAAGLLERQHLQEWVIAHPQILGPGILVVAVEYDAWVVDGDAQRDRLDVLGLDADGRLVVVELKRGFAPDTVEMQAIKYAAMASRFQLGTIAAAHAAYLSRRGTSTTPDQAAEALQVHAETISDDTLADPRVVIIAQGFSPVVISSVVWLANHGVEVALVRFQPYQQPDGEVFVTFSRLYPLPDLDRSIVEPGMASPAVSAQLLPSVDWTTADLVALGRLANVTTRTVLDICSEKPDTHVSLTEIVNVAGVTRAQARGQLAGLTMVMKKRFGRRNWPFTVHWSVDGSQQAFYIMTSEAAAHWHQASIQLDAEHSDQATVLDSLSEAHDQSTDGPGRSL